MDSEFRQLLVILFLSVPGALLLVGGVGYYLARQALAPIARLHQMTQEITAERLDRRLPVLNTRDELGRLTQTINAMIGRLEKSFHEIRRFTADASHELRTPLAAIRTEAEVALARPLSVAEHQNLLGSILEECERLNRLTDQLLTLAREEARDSTPAWEPVDLAAVVGKVVDIMRPLAETRGQRVETTLNGPLLVRGEENRLSQVLLNVLGNAIKYTPPAGTIAVAGNRCNGSVRVIVRDTGIGIAAEHLPHVFERFYRVDKARGREGTGLGLSIARNIITSHGGEIRLASQAGAGTTVTITLPAAATT